MADLTSSTAPAADPGERDLWTDYAVFHGLMEGAEDLDPVYPVYADMASRLGMSTQDRIRLALLHAAYYHTGSALYAFERTRSIADLGTAPVLGRGLPCGTERRGHRDPGALITHLNSLARHSEDILRWVERARQYDGDVDTRWSPYEGWRYLTGCLETLHGNGRWGVYKTAELLQRIVPLPVDAPDMGHAHSSGPRKGLALLYEDLPQDSSPATIRHLDRLSYEVMRHLAAYGHTVTPATVETSLCDFHALTDGRYYVGRDIDRMQEQLADVPSGLVNEALVSRYNTLPTDYLGEISGWNGRDLDRQKIYRDTGRIVTR